ncbi:MAG: flagellar basal body L-ring protein FlgH [Pseudomonadota bacterium]
MKFLNNTLRNGCVCVLTLIMSGCVVQMMRGPDYSPPLPVEAATGPAEAGAIYQQNVDVRLFEDLRARRVGDILTIRLQENTTAAKSSSTTAGKSSSADFASPSILGQTVTRDGNEVLSATLSGSAQFNGEGTSAQSNSLDGDITVTVVKRLSNGNLLVRGEKWVTLNQGDEFIRLSGIVRPYDIGTDNSVASSRVADARITYSSKGVLAAANKMGWLQRFVQSAWFPN